MKIGLISPHPDVIAFGLRSLSACLKKAGHDVKLIFLAREFYKKFGDRVLEDTVEVLRDVDLVGLTLMTNFFDNSIQITQKLKKGLGVPVVWGGVHPTIRPEECLDYADIAFVGEGEEKFVELVKRMENGEDYHDLEGVCFREQGELIINKGAPIVENLDAVPFQDIDYESHYIAKKNSLVKMTLDDMNSCSGGEYNTMPTRGCPFACTFCVNDHLNKMNAGQPIIRNRSMDNVIEELVQAKKKLPYIESIYFDDDAFIMLQKEEIKEFCDGYKERVKLPFYVGGITPTTLQREKLAMLVDAGVNSISMGIQSGNESTKADYKRKYSNQRVQKAAALMNEFKDQVGPPHYGIILDNPWETDEELRETLMFLTTLPSPFSIGLFSLTFYPGTGLYDQAKADGLIKDDLNDVYRKLYGGSGVSKTYFNRVFFLLEASWGNISTKTMSLLLNKTLMRLKLNWPLYWAFRTKHTHPVRLISKGLRAVRRREVWRITRWFYSWFGQKTPSAWMPFEGSLDNLVASFSKERTAKNEYGYMEPAGGIKPPTY